MNSISRSVNLFSLFSSLFAYPQFCNFLFHRISKFYASAISCKRDANGMMYRHRTHSRLIYLLLNDTWRSIKFYFRTQLSVASSRFRESYSSLAMLSIIPAFRYSTNCLGIRFREILQRCTCRIMNTSFQLINS